MGVSLNFLNSVTMQKHTRRGISLLEIVVATILLALTVWGLTALFLTAKQLNRHSALYLSAAQISRFYLNALYRDVRADRTETPTADNCFSSPPGGCEPTIFVDPNHNTTYTPNFEVWPYQGTYKVRLRLNWNE